MVNYPYYATPQNISQFYQQQRQAFEQPQSQIGIKGRPVTSIDEVRATTIDFDGSIFYFPDLANKRIYTKQINYDGTSTLNIYELKPVNNNGNNSNNQYVTREEFATFIAQLQQKLAATEVQGAPQMVEQQNESKLKELTPPQIEQPASSSTSVQTTNKFNF